MKPVFQTRFSTRGNCWPACLASYFEVPLEEVDHCACHHSDWQIQTSKWLAERNLFYLEIDVKKAGFTEFPEGAILLAGITSKSGLLHSVVIQARQAGPNRVEFYVIHDPLYPDLERKYEIEHLIVFCALKI